MTFRFAYRVLAVAAACVVVVVGCGDDRDGSIHLVDRTVDVEARDNVFEPDELEVAAGTTIRFVNRGRNDHNVIPVDDAHEVLTVEVDEFGPGAEAMVRLTEPGTYRYFCSIHGTKTAGMVGVIEVSG